MSKKLDYLHAEFEIALRDEIVTGAGLCAFASNGRTLIAEGIGKCDVGANAPDFTLDTTFWLASSTKLLTSVAVLQLVEKGLLSLEESVDRLLPELAHASIITGVDGETGKTILKPAKKKMNFVHLLTHSSGLGYHDHHPWLSRYRKEVGTQTVGSNSLPTELHATCVLLFEPGESWQYGVSLDFAGLAVERATGMKLGEYMEEEIFKPLNMNSTAFNVADQIDIVSKMHGRVRRGADGKVAREKTDRFLPTVSAFDAGGNGLYSSSRDFAKVMRSLITGDGVLLRRETADSLRSGYLGTKAKAALARWIKDPVYTPSEVWGLPLEDEEIDVDHGLAGVVVPNALPGIAGAGLVFWGGLPNNHWYLDFDRGVAGFYGTWLMPTADAPTSRLFDLFQAAAYEMAGQDYEDSRHRQVNDE